MTNIFQKGSDFCMNYKQEKELLKRNKDRNKVVRKGRKSNTNKTPPAIHMIEQPVSRATFGNNLNATLSNVIDRSA